MLYEYTICYILYFYAIFVAHLKNIDELYGMVDSKAVL